MQSFPSTRASSRVRTLTNGSNGVAAINTSPIATRLISLQDGEGTPIGPESHPAIHAGRVALITGAASGIGFQLCLELAHLGLRIVMADVNEDDLKAAAEEIAQIVGQANVLAVPTDVSQIDQVERLRDHVFETYGEVNVLFNNAGVGLYGGALNGLENWRKVMDVNLFGSLNVLQTFTNSMIHQENPSIIVNTGSKQGITNPPGNAAYNASKAGVRILTENLAYELREAGAKVTAHLFVPGWTYTQMTGATSFDGRGEKPPGAFTAEETVWYLLNKLRDGKFYIICPDNECSEDLDRLRIKWAAGDLVEGRPALSRWHPEWKNTFDEYVSSGLNHFEDRRVQKERRGIKTPTVQGDNL
ncbi:hypothetical protein FRC04_008998 [Tulasnella sp. 424]|nr:hypothetical protein FRC04_008998 [Tulasnella sp. 424]KAG8973655.1 hypothetical protein FRC05_008592 [Tulasnella sp. 425]